MRTIKDPDGGEIELAARPGRAEFERAAAEIRSALQATRLWPAGSISRCPNCAEDSFVGRDDLTLEVPRAGVVVIFRHLHGARCSRCNAQTLEPSEELDIESETAAGIVADYEAKVSNIGSGTVGTYWPKDVVRVMGLNPDKKAFIHVLDRDTALIKFRRARPGSEGKRKSKKKKS